MREELETVTALPADTNRVRLGLTPFLPWTFADSVFCRLRQLAGLELSISVLVTAEIIAQVYYQALAAASMSRPTSLFEQFLFRAKLADNAFLVTVAVAIGCLGGFGAVLFRKLVGAVERLFWEAGRSPLPPPHFPEEPERRS